MTGNHYHQQSLKYPPGKMDSICLGWKIALSLPAPAADPYSLKRRKISTPELFPFLINIIRRGQEVSRSVQKWLDNWATCPSLLKVHNQRNYWALFVKFPLPPHPLALGRSGRGGQFKTRPGCQVGCLLSATWGKRTRGQGSGEWLPSLQTREGKTPNTNPTQQM